MDDLSSACLHFSRALWDGTPVVRKSNDHDHDQDSLSDAASASTITASTSLERKRKSPPSLDKGRGLRISSDSSSSSIASISMKSPRSRSRSNSLNTEIVCLEEKDIMEIIANCKQTQSTIRPFMLDPEIMKKLGLSSEDLTPLVVDYLKRYLRNVPALIRSTLLANVIKEQEFSSVESEIDDDSSRNCNSDCHKFDSNFEEEDSSSSCHNPHKISIDRLLSLNQLSAHLISIRKDSMQRHGRHLLLKYMTHPKNVNIFNTPVDHEGLGLIDYLDKVPNPMDLGTIKSKLQLQSYESIEYLVDDLTRVFKNAIIYNPESHYVHENAKQLLLELESDLASLFEKISKENDRKISHKCAECGGACCVLCGDKCIKMEIPVLLCHGNCNQKIKRNSIYYISTDGCNTYCQKCFSALPATVIDDGVVAPLLKHQMLKRRVDEEISEPWIQCDTCHSWMHQICALYDKTISSETATFRCPLCLIEAVGGKYLSSKSSADFALSTSASHDKLFADSLSSFVKARVTSRMTYRSGFSPLASLTSLMSPTFSSSHATDLKTFATLGVESAIHGEQASATNNSEYVIADSKRFRSDNEVKEEEEESAYNKAIVANLDANAKEAGLEIAAVSATNLVTPSSDTGSDESFNDMHAASKDEIASAANRISVGGSVGGGRRCGTVSDNESMNSTRFEEIPDSANLNPHSLQMLIDSTAAASSSSSSSSAAGGFPINGTPHEYSQSFKASDLPKSKLSDFLECLVHNRLKETGYGHVMSSLTIRMVSNMDHMIEVPGVISDNFMTSTGHKVPHILPLRQKTILLFQEVDGIDVCVFCLYAQEFPKQCPPPNESVVYIAYLDSVDYFRPIDARTLVYHEIMVGYMKWVQMRGFKQCHIWACPPQRGDNFIFWCHPGHQKTPSRDRLTAWYQAILARCSHLGLVQNIENLFDSYFHEYVGIERSRDNQRQAAKNFVYSGLSKLSRQGISRSNSLTSIKDDAPSLSRSSSKSNFNISDAVTAVSEIITPQLPSAPICPPIFEGDYWILECVRSHRVVAMRVRGYDGKDFNLNLKRVKELLKNLMSKPMAIPFNVPVDYVALNIPDYPLVVLNPMDLGTIKNNLNNTTSNIYPNILAVANDVRLTFNNAILYNPLSHPIHLSAFSLLQEFESLLIDLVTSFNEMNGMGGIHSGNDKSLDDVLATYTLKLQNQQLTGPFILTSSAAKQISSSDSSSSSSSVNQGQSQPWQNEKVSSGFSGRVSFDTTATTTNYSYNDNNGNNSNYLKQQDSMDADTSFSSIERSESRQRSNSSNSSGNYYSPSIDGDFDNGSKGSGDRDETFDDYECDNSSGNGSNSLRRSDSNFSNVDSVDGGNESINNNADSWSRPMLGNRSMLVQMPSRLNRTTSKDSSLDESLSSSHHPASSIDHQSEKFERPVLGFRGAQVLMSEISKGVNRLKDDLFVVKFANPNLPSTTAATATIASQKVSSYDMLDSRDLNSSSAAAVVEGMCDNDDVDAVDDDDDFTNNESNNVTMDHSNNNKSNYDEGDESLDGSALIRTEDDRRQHSSSSLAMASRNNNNKSRNNKNNKNNKLLPKSVSKALPRLEAFGLGSPFFSAECLSHLQSIKADTSDPDSISQCPFVDTRYTFMEMLQYRRMQYDSLRRAKHSSLVLLYNIHRPFDESCRPRCAECNLIIHEIRWHCSTCANFDLCSNCYSGNSSSSASLSSSLSSSSSSSSMVTDSKSKKHHHPSHPHAMAPVRVTFI